MYIERTDNMKELFHEPPVLCGRDLILRPLVRPDAKELQDHRGIEIITASTMVENHASAHVLENKGFTLVNRAVDEDWGFPQPTPADKWIR
jgi:hypothetical protein